MSDPVAAPSPSALHRAGIHPTALVIAVVGLLLSVTGFLFAYRETANREDERIAEVSTAVAERVGDALVDIDALVSGIEGTLIATEGANQDELERLMSLRVEQSQLITSATLLKAEEGARLDFFAQAGDSRYLDLDELAAEPDLLAQRVDLLAAIPVGSAGLVASEPSDQGTAGALAMVFSTPSQTGDGEDTWVMEVESDFTRELLAPVTAGLDGDPEVAAYLGDDPDPASLLFATGAAAVERSRGDGIVPLRSDTVLVSMAPESDVLSGRERVSPLLVFVAGLTLTAVLTPLVGRLANRREEVRLLSAQRDELDRALGVSRRIEGELRASEQRFRSVLQSSPDVVLWIDADTPTVQILNRDDFLGHPLDEHLTLDRIIELTHPDDREAVRHGIDGLRSGLAGTLIEFECRLTNAGGAVEWLRLRGARVHREDGSQGPILAVLSVISDQKQEEARRAQLEAQLQQSQRLEAVGQLAGGVAHDFNNILAAIVSGAELVLDEVDGQTHEDVEEIRRTARRGSDLARQLLLFSRRDRGSAPEVVDVNRVIRDVETMLGRTLDESVELLVEMDDEVPLVHIDPSQIERILMNLTINARDAMPEGGRITISTATADLDEDQVATRPSLRAGRHLRLQITDTGTGMPDEVRDHAFEPFFSTKTVGKGTGLGLATVYGIVQGAQGHIEIDSEVGQGTTFTIFLPETRLRTGGTSPDRDETGAVEGGTERVLLVEDEDGVREATRRLLVKHGYTVTVASDGPHALEALTPEVQLVLTDVLMPGGMNGRDVAQAVRRERPDCAILYMTGHSDDVLDTVGIDDDPEEALVVRKPFTEAELLRAVRAALAQVPQRTP